MDSRPVVLVVEDEPLIGLSVADGLEEAGFDVRLVHTAGDALHELEIGGRDIVAFLTDIRLGRGQDGWQLARRAREAKPLIPVVYMSGDSAADHPAQGVPHSIMVQKPFAAAQIVAAVSNLINKVPPSPPPDSAD